MISLETWADLVHALFTGHKQVKWNVKTCAVKVLTASQKPLLWCIALRSCPNTLHKRELEPGVEVSAKGSGALADGNTGAVMPGALEMFLLKPLLTTIRAPPWSVAALKRRYSRAATTKPWHSPLSLSLRFCPETAPALSNCSCC